MFLPSSLVERVALRVALAAPIFVMLLSASVQADFIDMSLRALTMTAMAGCALWCIFVPRLPSMAHLLLLATGIIFSGFAYGLGLRGFTDYAPLLMIAPQALLFGTSIQHVLEDAGGERA
ncbi:hypothetical protein ACFOMD_13610 [Sphingoaurantiacus capsulatus]|uniref:Uncharacterized protein n=1 Tax=Sphingoaurantiacus capsulatus TaxID=1771310 RepID=A0ABV7XEA6_9SPHN